MGEMIVGPDWLFLLCYHTKATHQPARELYRAFILLRKRTGHLLDLDSESYRRPLEWAISRGRIPHLLIRCVRCGTEAWAEDWIKCGEMSPEQRESIRADNPAHSDGGRLDFLAKCRGGDYKRVVHSNRDWPEML